MRILRLWGCLKYRNYVEVNTVVVLLRLKTTTHWWVTSISKLKPWKNSKHIDNSHQASNSLPTPKHNCKKLPKPKYFSPFFSYSLLLLPLLKGDRKCLKRSYPPASKGLKAPLSPLSLNLRLPSWDLGCPWNQASRIEKTQKNVRI